MTNMTLPPLTLIRSRLARLTQAQTQQLADETGVGYGTLMKIRLGLTKNPGLETVRQFFPVLMDKK